jgi:hypothetical protein
MAHGHRMQVRSDEKFIAASRIIEWELARQVRVGDDISTAKDDNAVRAWPLGCSVKLTRRDCGGQLGGALCWTQETVTDQQQTDPLKLMLNDPLHYRDITATVETYNEIC